MHLCFIVHYYSMSAGIYCSGIRSDANALPMIHSYCLTDHKVLSTLEKPRESASAPTLEAAMPETSHRSSVSSRIQILYFSVSLSTPRENERLLSSNNMRALILLFWITCVLFQCTYNILADNRKVLAFFPANELL